MTLMTHSVASAVRSVNRNALRIYTEGKITEEELHKVVKAGNVYLARVEEVITDTSALEQDLFSDPVLAAMEVFTTRRSDNATKATPRKALSASESGES